MQGSGGQRPQGGVGVIAGNKKRESEAWLGERLKKR